MVSRSPLYVRQSLLVAPTSHLQIYTFCFRIDPPRQTDGSPMVCFLWPSMRCSRREFLGLCRILLLSSAFGRLPDFLYSPPPLLPMHVHDHLLADTSYLKALSSSSHGVSLSFFCSPSTHTDTIPSMLDLAVSTSCNPSNRHSLQPSR